LLQDESYNVTTTNFVPQSFESIAVAKPSLLIIDLVYGERAGWNLLAQLHEAAATRNIPILLMSTSLHLLDQAKEAHARFGGDRYLTKPFDLDDLLANVRALIGSA
jgi:DNA-binding response OmpR family regulator